MYYKSACVVSPRVSCDLLKTFPLPPPRHKNPITNLGVFNILQCEIPKCVMCVCVHIYAKVDQTKTTSGVISWRLNTPLLRKGLSLGWSLPSRFGQRISLLLNPGTEIINMLYRNTCVSHMSGISSHPYAYKKTT